MRFWDSSAVVPLLIEQPSSGRARTLLSEDPDVVIWWATAVECASAFGRLRREGGLDVSDEGRLVRDLERWRLGCYEMLPGEGVRAQALRVLRLHALRAADALQLAAALEWADAPSGATLVSFDERLAAAAELEGFSVLGS